MLLIDNETKTIAFNRADEVNFILELNDEDGNPFPLLNSDYVRLNVMAKKDYISGPVFSKVFKADGGENTVQITLTSREMALFEKTNRQTTYWYDLVLNDTETLIGFESSDADNKGAKKLIILPRGEDEYA